MGGVSCAKKDDFPEVERLDLFSATHFDGFEKLHLPFIFRLFVRFERFAPLFRPLRMVEFRQVIDDLRSA